MHLLLTEFCLALTRMTQQDLLENGSQVEKHGLTVTGGGRNKVLTYDRCCSDSLLDNRTTLKRLYEESPNQQEKSEHQPIVPSPCPASDGTYSAPVQEEMQENQWPHRRNSEPITRSPKLFQVAEKGSERRLRETLQRRADNERKRRAATRIMEQESIHYMAECAVRFDSFRHSLGSNQGPDDGHPSSGPTTPRKGQRKQLRKCSLPNISFNVVKLGVINEEP